MGDYTVEGLATETDKHIITESFLKENELVDTSIWLNGDAETGNAELGFSGACNVWQVAPVLGVNQWTNVSQVNALKNVNISLAESTTLTTNTKSQHKVTMRPPIA